MVNQVLFDFPGLTMTYLQEWNISGTALEHTSRYFVSRESTQTHRINVLYSIFTLHLGDFLW